MIHKHSITKNILDATPVILGAAASTDMVTFAYGTLKKALERTTGHSGEIEFGYDDTTKGGQILVGGTPVTSKILDVDAADKSNASTGVQTVTVTYVDSTQSNGKNTKTFEVISDAAVKAHIAAADAALIGTVDDASSLNTINAAKNYANAAGWTIDYVTNTKKIQLKSQGGTVISEIDATAFIKDGMLNSAQLVTTKPSEGATAYTGNGPWLVLTFNTDAGKDPIVLDVDGLLDTYTSGNANQLTISNYVITPVTADPSSASTEAQRAGLATAGLVKDYVDAKVTSKNVDATGETGDSALVTASANNNEVTVGSTSKLQNAVTLAEGAVQSVVEGTSPSEHYVALSISESDASVVTITISDAELVTKFNTVDTSINNNNASIVRLNTSVNALEDALVDVSVTAAGDTLISAAQDGTNHMKINVAATADLTAAVGNANSAVQTGAVGTNATAYLNITKNTSTLTVEFDEAPIDTSTAVNALTGTSGSNQFVTAKAVKEFVDYKTSALSWIML